MENSLYKRIGGDEAVRAAVNKMYDKILVDAELAPFFEHVNVATLRHSQTAFVIFAFGGYNEPHHSSDLNVGKRNILDKYTGVNLRAVHTRAVAQGLSDRHFDLVAGHLEQSMRELGVAEELIAEAMAIVGSTREAVLNK